jgi:hypothetical protein
MFIDNVREQTTATRFTNVEDVREATRPSVVRIGNVERLLAGRVEASEPVKSVAILRAVAERLKVVHVLRVHGEHIVEASIVVGLKLSRVTFQIQNRRSASVAIHRTCGGSAKVSS